MQTIAYAQCGADAALTVALLEAHGLRVAAADLHSNVLLSHYSQALGGIRIGVIAADADPARRLIAALDAPPARRPGWAMMTLFVAAFLLAGVAPPLRGLTPVLPRAERRLA